MDMEPAGWTFGERVDRGEIVQKLPGALKWQRSELGGGGRT